jgi:hypothetical protein
MKRSFFQKETKSTGEGRGRVRGKKDYLASEG